MTQAFVSVDGKRCKSCGICLSLCPHRVFCPVEGGGVKVGWPERCTGCMQCENLCPDFAITVCAATEGRKGDQTWSPVV